MYPDHCDLGSQPCREWLCHENPPAAIVASSKVIAMADLRYDAMDEAPSGGTMDTKAEPAWQRENPLGHAEFGNKAF